jgi:hypothetical protein
LVEQFAGKKDCMVMIKKLPLKEYCNVLARSVFALCPRGYGKSSFRIAEAIHYGAVPVYVSDEFVFPYNILYPGIFLQPGGDIYGFLKQRDPDGHLDAMKELGQYYTYQGCKQKILQEVNK